MALFAVINLPVFLSLAQLHTQLKNTGLRRLSGQCFSCCCQKLSDSSGGSPPYLRIKLLQDLIHVSQTIEIIFESILYCWEIDSKKYFNNPLVKVIGSSDKGRIKFKNKNPDRRMGINIAYAALYNAVSLNASTAPPIEIALEKIS